MSSESMAKGVRSRLHLGSTDKFGFDRLTAGLALVGLVVRLALVFPGPLASKVEFLSNKADLRNYYWPAQVATEGKNPYVLWATGKSGDFRADMSPLELLIFTGTVQVWNDPRAIQLLFAIFDTVNIVVLGALFSQSRIRRPFQVFYAFGPLTLYNLVLVPQDKTIVITLTLSLFFLLARSAARASAASAAISAGDSPFWCEVALCRHHVSRLTDQESRRAILIIALAALLTSFKWLGAFFLIPLIGFVSPNLRRLAVNGLVFGLVVLLSHLPWFPTWTFMYAFRLGRGTTPIHIAPSVLLDVIGLYNRTVLLAALVLSLVAIYALFWSKRISIFETIALSVAIGVLWTPDMDPVHLSLVAVYLLLILDWSSKWRQAVVWVLGALVVFVYAASTHTGYARYGLPDFQAVTGSYGSLQMIILSYPLFLAVLGLFLFDTFAGRRLTRHQR